MSDWFSGIFHSFFGTPRLNDDRGEQNNDEAFGFQNFNIDTDPLELHQFVENQINEIVKVFTGIEIGGFPAGGSHFDGPSSLNPSSITDSDTKGNIRDQYIKPGYRDGYLNKNIKSDNDLDGKITSADLNTLITDENGKMKVYPETRWKSANKYGSHFYGSSTIITQHSDGTIEKRHIQRDHLGNEKTTVKVTKPADSSTSQPDCTNTTAEIKADGNIWHIII